MSRLRTPRALDVSKVSPALSCGVSTAGFLTIGSFATGGSGSATGGVGASGSGTSVTGFSTTGGGESLIGSGGTSPTASRIVVAEICSGVGLPYGLLSVTPTETAWSASSLNVISNSE